MLNTKKEYDEKKINHSFKIDRSREQKKEIIESAPVELITYILQYPDIPRNGTKNFESKKVIDGEIIPFECKNGLVKTKNGKLKDNLLKCGYIFLKEVNDELEDTDRITG
jgi:hypothetical protein